MAMTVPGMFLSQPGRATKDSRLRVPMMRALAGRAGAEPADLLRSLVVAGVQVHSFEPLLAPMEDIFLNVVTEAGREPLA